MASSPDPGDRPPRGRVRRRLFWRLLVPLALGGVLLWVSGRLTDALLRRDFPAAVDDAPLVRQILWALIVFAVGTWVAGVLVRAAERRFARGRRDLYGLTLLIRIGVYTVLLAVVLSIFRVSLAGVLAGSAVGGVVLGFAIHTFASNLLTGLFATSSGALNYGDVLAVNSWIWNIDTVGKIVEIKALFSKMETPDGAIVSVPNSALLGSSVLVSYRREDGRYVYPVRTMINADVPLALVLEEARRDAALRDVDVFVQSRDTVNNTLRLLVRFREPAELNGAIHRALAAVDAAYWKVRNAAALFGPSALAAADGVYPHLVTVPADVPPEALVRAARERGLEACLVGRSATGYTWLLPLPAGEDLRRALESRTLAFEAVYRALRDRPASGGRSPAPRH